MRLRNLILGEFRFIYKYGILALYIIFTIIYLLFLSALPESAKKMVAVILVFTDPAAMGLFFMGAVILLEKSQRVQSALGVAPIKKAEYIIAKIIPMMVVGALVSIIICLFAGLKNIPLIIVGVALASILFSLCGLMVGSNIKSLNGFMIAIVPFEVVFCTPPILYLFGFIKKSVWIIYPGISAIRLIEGNNKLWYLEVAVIILWIIPIFLFCKKAVTKSFSVMGGVKI